MPLDLYVIMKDKEDAESLAGEILTFLYRYQSRDGEKVSCPLEKLSARYPRIRTTGCLQVIEELRKEDTAVSCKPLRNHIESFTEL